MQVPISSSYHCAIEMHNPATTMFNSHTVGENGFLSHHCNMGNLRVEQGSRPAVRLAGDTRRSQFRTIYALFPKNSHFSLASGSLSGLIVVYVTSSVENPTLPPPAILPFPPLT